MKMIIYEVRVTVDERSRSEFERYMRETHIPDVIGTGAFTRASFEYSTPGRYRTRYAADTREALDTYLAEHAPRLREDFSAHFPTGVEVTREEWKVIERFP